MAKSSPLHLAETLRQMAKTDASRSETARLRDVFQEVEQALASGVSRAKVLEALHADGFTMTMKSFESALYRLRKKQPTTGKPAGAVQQPALPKPATTTEVRPPRFEHNPTPPSDILE